MIRRSVQVHSVRPPQLAIAREKYFFYERNTGVAHFHVETDEQGRFPVEQAAGLLAMHCVVRNQTPSTPITSAQAEESAATTLPATTSQRALPRNPIPDHRRVLDAIAASQLSMTVRACEANGDEKEPATIVAKVVSPASGAGPVQMTWLS